MAAESRVRGGEPTAKALKQATIAQAIAEGGATLRAVVKWAALVAIAYFAVYRTISALAGKQTGADFMVAILTHEKLACSVSIAFGGGGLLYGWRRKKLLEDAIQDLAPVRKESERNADPGRDSSGLTERGKTRPEDEL